MKKLLFTLTFALLLFTINAQNVGIGEINPQSKLEIKTNSSLNYPQLTLMENEDDFSRLTFSSTAQPNSFWTIAARPLTTTLGKMNFFYQTKGDLMTLTSDGNLGIGTTSPVVRLDVTSSQDFQLAKFDGGDQMYMSIHENGNYLGYWGSFTGEPNDIDFGTGSGSNAKLHFTTKAIPRLTIDKTGNVGVGTVAPQEKLDVNGNINLSGSLKINGSAGTAGQVLTSTGSGAPEWRSMNVSNVFPNVRFAAEISDGYGIKDGELNYLWWGTTYYNSSPSDISIYKDSIVVRLSGLYHLEFSINYLNTVLNPTEKIDLRLNTIYPFADLYLLVGEPFYSGENRSFHFSIDINLTAPQKIVLIIIGNGSGSPHSGIGSLAGSIRGYLIHP